MSWLVVGKATCRALFLLINMTKRLVGVLDSAVNVERGHVDVVDTAGNLLQVCDITQSLELGAVKDLLLDLERLERFAPFQSTQQLLTGFVDVSRIGTKKLLEDEKGAEARHGCFISNRTREFNTVHLTVASFFNHPSELGHGLNQRMTLGQLAPVTRLSFRGVWLDRRWHIYRRVSLLSTNALYRANTLVSSEVEPIASCDEP
jgi:hypothetical protein